MSLVLFHDHFPAVARAETRSFTVTAGELAGDEYALLEAYCPKPGCDCRRVMLNVFSRQRRAVVASISFAFDPEDEFRGPFLDPVNPQSELAGALLETVGTILEDAAYVARLESHYRMMKSPSQATGVGGNARARRARRRREER